MAYAQWVHIIIQNKMASGEITVKQAEALWGKFYKWDNKDDEITAAEVDKQVATRNNNADIAACGRSDAASGTEGSLNLYDGGNKICYVYWNCPWGSKTNEFTISSISDSYVVQQSGANLNSGAIGNVTIKVVKMD
jgi:hypothetical protein